MLMLQLVSETYLIQCIMKMEAMTATTVWLYDGHVHTEKIWIFGGEQKVHNFTSCLLLVLVVGARSDCTDSTTFSSSIARISRIGSAAPIAKITWISKEMFIFNLESNITVVWVLGRGWKFILPFTVVYWSVTTLTSHARQQLTLQYLNSGDLANIPPITRPHCVSSRVELNPDH